MSAETRSFQARLLDILYTASDLTTVQEQHARIVDLVADWIHDRVCDDAVRIELQGQTHLCLAWREEMGA